MSDCNCTQRRRGQDQVCSNSNLNMVGSELERSSWVMLHRNVVEVAKDVWDFGKQIGLIYKGEEGEIVQELALRVGERMGQI